MFTFIRSFIFNIFLYLWTAILSIICLPIAFIFKNSTEKYLARFWAKGLMIAVRLICGIKYEVLGKKNIPKNAAIIASKHQSAWETICFFLILEKPVFILKKSLIQIPIFGIYLKKLGCISVNRDGSLKDAKNMVKQTKIALENNKQVIIFPEGTRVKHGEKTPYNKGVGFLYQSLKRPVTPVNLNSGLFWGREAFLKKSGVIKVKFLPKIKEKIQQAEFLEVLENTIEKDKI